MPGVVKDRHGDDVRDVLQMPDGEKLVHDAIAAAIVWKPVQDFDGETHQDNP